MDAWLLEEFELIERTRLSVESASSAGRTISSSTWAGSALGYGIWISSPGKSTSGRNASGSRCDETAPTSSMVTIVIPAVTG